MTPLQLAQKHRDVVAALLAIAGLAWWWTVRRMAGMDAGPGTDLGALGWFTGSWVVMMAAMMLPSFAPTLAAFAASGRGREPSRWLLFTCGYLLAWAAAGVGAYAVFVSGRGLLGRELAWHRDGSWLCAAIILAAAAYEFVPLKAACLQRCRGQLGELTRSAHAHALMALAVGTRSGAWCIGCSWALMAALFALGIMSITWMIVVAALVALEKLGPWPRAARLLTALVLVALAAGILAVPHQVPGLVVPPASR